MFSRRRIKALLKPPFGLTVIGGLSMGATAAPVGAWPLAWVALAPLWIVVYSSDHMRPDGARSVRSAAGYGFIWGFLYGGIVVHWLWFLHPLTWMGVPWLASLAIAAFCWGIVAITGGLWIGAWAACFALLSRFAGYQRSTWAVAQRLLLGTALWAGLDMIMRQGILYWPSLALTQSPVNLVALHLSRLSGPTTLAVAIVAVNGLLAEAWLQARWMRLDAKGVPQRESTQFHGLNPSKGLKGSEAVRPKHLIAAALGVLIGGHGLGLLILHLPTPSGVPLTVGIIQGNIPTRIKLYGEGIRRALQGYTQGYELLAAQGAQVVVLPEGALPFRWRQESEPERGPKSGPERGPEARNPLAAAIRDRGVTALVGTFALQEGKLTQSLLAVEGNGTIAGRYDKLKLVPLGEYIPLQDTLGKLVGRLSPVQSDMLPGSSRQTFMAGFGQAIAGICYESAFPELFRQQAAAGGTLIITASNNDPYPTTMMAQHHAQDLMRAIEMDRWAVRATNTGYSGIVDPHGRTQWRSEANIYALKLTTVAQRSTQTLYVRWGDWLTPTLLSIAGLWLSITWIKGRFFADEMRDRP